MEAALASQSTRRLMFFRFSKAIEKCCGLQRNRHAWQAALRLLQRRCISFLRMTVWGAA